MPYRLATSQCLTGHTGDYTMNKIVLQSFFRENRYNPESFHPFFWFQVLSKTSDPRSEVFVLALPIFPASHPASIVGANELNFCVRDGNRWTLIAINTNSYGWLFTIVYVKSASLLTTYMIAPFSAPVNSYFTAPVTRTIWSL